MSKNPQEGKFKNDAEKVAQFKARCNKEFLDFEKEIKSLKEFLKRKNLLSQQLKYAQTFQTYDSEWTGIGQSPDNYQQKLNWFNRSYSQPFKNDTDRLKYVRERCKWEHQWLTEQITLLKKYLQSKDLLESYYLTTQSFTQFPASKTWKNLYKDWTGIGKTPYEYNSRGQRFDDLYFKR